MSNLSSDTKSQLFELFQQVTYLNRLDNKIQVLFGQSDDTPLDVSVNSLLDVFLYFSGATENLTHYELDDVFDVIFNDKEINDVKKFEFIIDMIEKEKPMKEGGVK